MKAPKTTTADPGDPAGMQYEAQPSLHRAELEALFEKRHKKQRKAKKRKFRHELRLLDEQHLHAVNMQERDREFALTLIGALMPVMQSIGQGILALQRNSLEAQKMRLEVERGIAEKSPGYALERIKMHAAAGRLMIE